MMLTVFGLPLEFTFNDIKALIHRECQVTDFILGNPTVEGGFKKARVGLANESEGWLIIKCLDGLRVQGYVLKVVPIGMSSTSHAEHNRSEHQHGHGNMVQPQVWNNQQSQWQTNITDMRHQHHLGFTQSVPSRNMQSQNLSKFSSNQSASYQAMSWTQQGQGMPLKHGIVSQGYDDRNPRQFMSKNKEMSGRMQQNYLTVNLESNQQSFSRPISPGHRFSPGRRMSPRRVSPGRRMSPGNRFSPRRRMSPKRVSPGRKISPASRFSPKRASPRRKMSPRRISPGRISPGKRYSPGRKMSPRKRYSPGRLSPGKSVSPGEWFFPGRGMSPGNRFSSVRRNSPESRMPPDRRISPSEKRQEMHDRYRKVSPGRHFSHSRRISPFERHNSSRRSPSNRKPSPFGRIDSKRGISPTRDITMEDRQSRQDFPARRLSPRHSSNSNARYSPSQLEDDPIDKYDLKSTFRNVRPAYEKTSNQDSSTTDFRQKHNEKPFETYSAQESRWSEREPPKTYRNDDRDIPNKPSLVSFLEQRMMEEQKKRSLSRDLQRDRSPVRGYHQRSPSPQSARKSWTRGQQPSDTSEVPPPPLWPGQNDTRFQGNKSGFSEKNINDLEPWQRKIEELRRRGHQNRNEITSSNDRPSPGRYSERSNRLETKVEEELIARESRGNPIDMPRSSRDEISNRDNYRRRSKSPYINVEIKNTDRHIKVLKILKPSELNKEVDDAAKRAEDFVKKSDKFHKGDKTDFARDTFRNHDGDQYLKKEDKKSKGIQIVLRDRKTEAKGTKYQLSAETKIKRQKAVDEISQKIMSKYGRDFAGDLNKRIHQELKEEIGRILYDMFGNEEVSFIESVIKFNTRHKDEMDIFKRVATSVLNDSTNLARQNSDDNDGPEETSRSSPVSKFSKEQLPVANVAEWNMGVNTNPVIQYPMGVVPPVGVMFPVQPKYPYVPSYEPVPEPNVENTDDFNLYLCKDDLSPFNSADEEALKTYIVDRLFRFTQMSQNSGWSPEFTLSTQANVFRREIITNDSRSRDWLLNLDFSEFKQFNVLIHTPEELWYVRAAIWLPGHSRCKNLEPLAKLKLQNKYLEGVDIGKWKFVKNIVTEKGMRLYVDIPPTSSRNLAKHKMQLSYELQKVNVFLKADAVDKDVFDQGLHDVSITNIPSAASFQMPLLSNEPSIVKFAIEGNKPMNAKIIRKVKDQILYKMFKYLQEGGSSKTDFLKYGFCRPGHFGVVPENEESRRWLCSLPLGEVSNKHIILVGGDNKNTRYIKMFINFPKPYYTVTNTSVAFKNLRQFNCKVKGLNFDLWKNAVLSKRGDNCIEVDIDLESVETISQKGFQLSYTSKDPVSVKSEYNTLELAEIIKKYKTEMKDSYVVANMDISSGSDDEDVIVCE